MATLSKEELKDLVSRKSDPSISIFIPTNPVEVKPQGPIRLKNLLKQVDGKLADRGMKQVEIDELLAQPRALLGDAGFWQELGCGLAIFASAELFKTYRLPIDFEEQVIVNNTFHIKPLLPMMSGNGKFYLLALSQNEVRFFKGTRDSMDQLQPETLTGTFKDYFESYEATRTLQWQTGTASPGGGGGERAAMYHGQNSGEQSEKEMLRQYFNRLDQGVRAFLKDEKSPLLLAGVEYETAIYREANKYPNLMEQSLDGNPEGLSAKELHDRAWQLVEPLYRRIESETVARYNTLSRTETASNQIEKIIPAAFFGRVEVLLAAKGIEKWGQFDPQSSEVKLSKESGMGKEDLVNLAAAQTLLNGGMVYLLDATEVPGGQPAAAIFRY